MECGICKRTTETRLGVCFDCAEAESIIKEGLDMYDKGINGTDKPAKKPLDKLQLLIDKGWKINNFVPESKSPRKKKVVVDPKKVIKREPKMLCSRCFGENCNCSINWFTKLVNIFIK